MKPGEPRTSGPSAPMPPAIATALRGVVEQLDLVVIHREALAGACATLSLSLSQSGATAAGPGISPDLAAACLDRLLPGARKRLGPAAAPLVDLLAMLLPWSPDPVPACRALLQARDADLRELGFQAAMKAAEASPSLRSGAAAVMAEAIERQPALWNVPGRRAQVDCLLRSFLVDNAMPSPGSPQDHDVDSLLAAGAFAGVSEADALLLRRLAARLLDEGGEPVSRDCLERLVGGRAAAVLAPLFAFTRGSHRDLLDILPGCADDALISSLEAAREVLGETLLGEVIGETRWARIALGLDVFPLVGISLDAGFPCVVSPAEAAVLEEALPFRRLWSRFLCVAHGGAGTDSGGAGIGSPGAGNGGTGAARGAAAGTIAGDPGSEVIARFRRYNVVHAELLGEILEIAPLTPAKARRILASLDEATEHFVALFAGHSEEAAALPTVYAALRAETLRMLEDAADDAPLGPQVTRLVQMFEDPRTLEEVRTLHGLKRYLHQQGLRLAFRLFKTGRAANRTVDLILVAGGSISVARRIRYIDFDPDPGWTGRRHLPYVIGLLVEAAARRVAQGRLEMPDVEALIYGNEVQLYVSFRNHPVFIRLDLSPPLRGGMIDLEYYGVSQYELDRHPELSLRHIQRVFRRFEFDVQVTGVRLHVRYDKERAFDFADLERRLRILFRLLPHLMELDWIIGHLDYPEGVRAAIDDAWADWLDRWGVIPVTDLLTRDQRRILQSSRYDPVDPEEAVWDGRGPYRDRFTPVATDPSLSPPAGAELPPPELRPPDPPDPAAAAWARLRALLEQARAVPGSWSETIGVPVAQVPLEDRVLGPLRKAGRRPPEGPEHPALLLAELLRRGGGPLGDAVALAAVVRSGERHLRFTTTGSIQGLAVQHGTLAMRDQCVEVDVLRDASGVVRLARAVTSLIPPWPWTTWPAQEETERSLDAVSLRALLRRNNYGAASEGEIAPAGGTPDEVSGAPGTAAGDETGALLEALAVRHPDPSPAPEPGDRSLTGTPAAPGIASGIARLGRRGGGTGDRRGRLDDDEDAILFLAAVRPQDTPALRRCAAVVSTGGGILSHAGLIAQELRKPALIIPGTWTAGEHEETSLRLRYLDYRIEERMVGSYQVQMRSAVREREEALRDCDLVVVDADRGVLSIFGQDPEALTLHHELRLLARVTREEPRAGDDQAVLASRGRMLRSLHQLERLLARLDRPELVRHAVRELLLARQANPLFARYEDRRRLLRALLDNPLRGSLARDTMLRRAAEARGRGQALAAEAVRVMAGSGLLCEILRARLAARRLRRLHEEADALLAGVGLEADAVSAALQAGAQETNGAKNVSGEAGLAPGATGSASYEEQPASGAPQDAAMGRGGGLLDVADIDARTIDRLLGLGEELGRRIEVPVDEPGLRHLLSRLRSTAHVLEAALPEESARLRGAAEAKSAALASGDAAAAERYRGRLTVSGDEGGCELASLIGSKGANLGEMSRILEAGSVPEWFAVTVWGRQAFLDQPVTPADLPLRSTTLLPPAGLENGEDSAGSSAGSPGGNGASFTRKLRLGEALAAVLDSGLDAARQAAAIGRLWAEVEAPPRLRAEILERYRAWGAPFVAVRSSALEEDTEETSWAGQFDTFLYVRGENELIEKVKMVLASFWSERALRHRAALGAARSLPQGAVIVQRIVEARVSGVAHSLSATTLTREMVLNAGLGLGEGVVSGEVEVDHVVVARSDDARGPRKGAGSPEEPIRFRYIVGDKNSQIVFNRRAGSGTIRESTLYHQRMRPALEYSDLRAIVLAVLRLEEVYGLPVDVEFGFEEDALRVLQVRPIVAFQDALRETLRQHPLGSAAREGREGKVEGAPRTKKPRSSLGRAAEASR